MLWKKKNTTKRYVLLLLCLLPIFVGARGYKKISSIRSLDRSITRHKFAVVLLYEFSRQERKNGDVCYATQELQDAFKAVSNYDQYRRAQVMFMTVNAAHRNLYTVARDLNVNRLPAVVLYKNGTVLEDKNGFPVMLHGLFSYQQLKAFIDTHLKKEIHAYVQWRAKETRRIVADYSSCGYGPYWYPAGWYYPYDYYWGWGYPYSRPWYYW